MNSLENLLKDIIKIDVRFVYIIRGDKMRVHSIIKSNNEFHRNLNSEHGNGHKRNNDTDISFYEMLKKYILKRIDKSNIILQNTKK
ncbi:hypothetical protein [Clostridium ljungdahlii]|uniref:Uncharacterized protein n=1 Tax=Clostridium ljungdahlii TaxID=1538 RepID=A0A168Q375_9CLOT|nr:hypothetical protein [Clostridium ljungdahlii]OAA88585.1 hypothetical protein WY13_01780 [Clostridium ljungdahlii]